MKQINELLNISGKSAILTGSQIVVDGGTLLS
jgi:hypothetical protein